MHTIIAAGLVLLAFPLAMARAQPIAICLHSDRIDHTVVQDNKTINFFMNNRAVYQNLLPLPCFGLLTETEGFTYEGLAGSDEICSNLTIIHLNTTGTSCHLGAFQKMPYHGR